MFRKTFEHLEPSGIPVDNGTEPWGTTWGLGEGREDVILTLAVFGQHIVLTAHC